MRITLKLYGNLKKYAPSKRESSQIEIENGTTIRSMLIRFGVPNTRVWMSAVNDQVVDDALELHDGDVLEIFEPVGGGAGHMSQDACRRQILFESCDLTCSL